MTTLLAVRGDRETYELTLVDAEAVALDLTGVSIWFTVKRAISDTDAEAVLQKTVGAGITVSSPLTGIALVTIDPADTESLPDQAAGFVYDVQVQLADGRIKTPMSGRFAITPDVTGGLVLQPDDAASQGLSYATLDQLLDTYGQRTTDSRKLGRYLDLLEAATAQINEELDMDFFRHPAGSGTEERFLTPSRGGRICVHEGIVSAEGTISISQDGGYSFDELAEGDWYLEPASPLRGYPYDHIRLAPTGSYSSWPSGARRIKADLAFGWERPPVTAREATIARARQLIHADPSGSGSVVGPEELGQMVGPVRIPEPMYRLIRHRQTQFWCHI